MSAPHCPRCFIDHADTGSWCKACGFNGGEADDTSWVRAVRAEIARQALELRARSMATREDYLSLAGAVVVVRGEYLALRGFPIKIPGDETQ